jgi:hypothetical protein
MCELGVCIKDMSMTDRSTRLVGRLIVEVRGW